MELVAVNLTNLVSMAKFPRFGPGLTKKWNPKVNNIPSKVYKHPLLLLRNVYPLFSKMSQLYFLEPWCAKIYLSNNFNGPYVSTNVGFDNLIREFNDSASSIQVQSGCSLKIFKNPNQVNQLETITEDIQYRHTRVSSYICECKGTCSISPQRFSSRSLFIW